MQVSFEPAILSVKFETEPPESRGDVVRKLAEMSDEHVHENTLENIYSAELREGLDAEECAHLLFAAAKNIPPRYEDIETGDYL
mgnify:CR=1 FL=1